MDFSTIGAVAVFAGALILMMSTKKYFHDPEIREFDMQHEQWLLGEEKYTGPVLEAIDEFMES